MRYLLIILPVISLISSFILNKVLLKFSSNLGIRNNNVTVVRWSKTSKPAMGGISFFIIFLISVIFYYSIFPVKSIQVTGIIASLLLAFFMGLADDAYNTKPLLKFLAQLFCGIILVVSGTYINLFDNMYWNYLFTVIWILGMMNSVNMLDNMDGVTTSISILVLTFSLLIGNMMNMNNNFLTITIIPIIASLVTFLFFNWHPSKMFMGDTGSQFLGLFLAIAGIHFVWNIPVSFNEHSLLFKFGLVFLVFLIPITDTTAVTINRIRKGSSPFVGGKDHTTHHLSYLGLSDSKVALILISVNVISGIFALKLTQLSQFTYVDFAWFLAPSLILSFLLFLNTFLSSPKNLAKKNVDLTIKHFNNNTVKVTEEITLTGVINKANEN